MISSFRSSIVAGLFFVSAASAVAADPFAGLNARFSPTTQNLRAVAFANGTYVAVGDGGTILTSTDSVSWVPRVAGTTNGLKNVTYGTNGFVAVSDSPPGLPGKILISADGMLWS